MDNIHLIFSEQKKFFNTGKTNNIEYRIEKLKILKEAIEENENIIFEALRKDLNKSKFESYETEVGLVLHEINLTIKNLRKWAKTKKVKTPIVHFGTGSYIYSEPYGVVLNISPWNYPFQLAVTPLIGAMAAGNCVMVKPSKYSPNTSDVIQHIIEENFSPEYISVVEPRGGRESILAILEEDFDYIFFTGSVAVGKVIMEKAAKHLTPVTLELGGKSPCIVHEDADLRLASKRIVWGKFLNAGQTCVAPDYLLVHEKVKDDLLKYIKEDIKDFFGHNPLESSDYPRIINAKQFHRLISYFDKGKIIMGGDYKEEEKYISPTIIEEVNWDYEIMQEEIFGPIFPLLTYKDLNEVISLLHSKPKSLALYFFSQSKKAQDKIIKEVSYGGGCINDTVIHVSSPYAPFGGVGNSGMGAYHGKTSFNLFSHNKSVLKKTNLFDISFRYAPYGDKLKILKKLLK